MVRQYVKVRGVGGGRAGTARPSAPRVAPRIVAIGNGRVRAINARRKA